MQAILARRQLEHGDRLSQRTFRVRHTTQLRGCANEGDVAFFSEGEAEEAPVLAGGVAVTAEIVTGGTCDMMEGNRRIDSVFRVLNDLWRALSPLLDA